MLTLDVERDYTQVWASHAVECWRTTSSVSITCSWVESYSTQLCEHHMQLSGGLHQVWASHAVEWRRTTSSVSITCSWVEEGYIKCEHHMQLSEEDYIKCENHMQLSGGGLHQVWASHAVEWRRTTSSVSITCSWVEEDYIKCEHHMQLSGGGLHQVWASGSPRLSNTYSNFLILFFFHLWCTLHASTLALYCCYCCLYHEHHVVHYKIIRTYHILLVL